MAENVKGSKPSFNIAHSTTVPIEKKSDPIFPLPPIHIWLQNGQNSKSKNFHVVPTKVRAEKMAKGICFYCDKPFERGRVCSFKEPQVFVVEVSLGNEELESREQDYFDGEAHISVGENKFNTMRVVGKNKEEGCAYSCWVVHTIFLI